VAALGFAFSAFYVFDRTLLIASVVFVTLFVLIAILWNVEQVFFHPSTIALELQASKEIVFDGAPYRLEVIWASPIVIFLRAVELERDRPRRVRVLLGKDALNDEQWLDVQTWRVWCQRG
jgi:hypothetical protein